MAFCDVDEKKIRQGVYTYEESTVLVQKLCVTEEISY